MWCTLVYSTTLLRNDLFHLLHKWSGSPCDEDPNAAAVVPIPVVVEPDPLLRPRRRYKSNGFLQVSCNGGLIQMRAGICDMVTIARYLNLTLLVPSLDKTSFWSDTSYSINHDFLSFRFYIDFKDVFDLEYFINSLRDEVRIVRSLPRMTSNVFVLSMPLRSWSSKQYYLTQILPLFRKHKVIYFTKTDTRIANNGIPVELQKLRCRVNYEALRFAPHIKDTGDKLISILKSIGSFIVLHLRYEMDMLSFSGCTRDCTWGSNNISAERLVDLLDKFQSQTISWEQFSFQVKDMHEHRKGQPGRRTVSPRLPKEEDYFYANPQECLAPLTPEFGICNMVTIARYLNLTLLVPSLDKTSFWSDTSDFKDAFDLEYFISSLRDEILPLFRKHKVIYFTKTVTRIANNGIPVELQKLRCRVNYEALRFAPHIKDTGDKLISILKSSGPFIVLHLRYEMDMLSFSGCTRGCSVTEADELTKKDIHEHRKGQPGRRTVSPRLPKEQDYFYANPQECLAPLTPEFGVAI
ncbi:hypothetical protein Sjap_001961 [Stephania japonica]|uniref:O-fucosyltransferase family protein n=1 Tax=Stephania japonica TaxID=461633 RepID=A0AAP0PVL3_9MAGN